MASVLQKKKRAKSGDTASCLYLSSCQPFYFHQNSVYANFHNIFPWYDIIAPAAQKTEQSCAARDNDGGHTSVFQIKVQVADHTEAPAIHNIDNFPAAEVGNFYHFTPLLSVPFLQYMPLGLPGNTKKKPAAACTLAGRSLRNNHPGQTGGFSGEEIGHGGYTPVKNPAVHFPYFRNTN
jgi:hypothetical protein